MINHILFQCNFKELFNLYHFLNILLAVAFILIKSIPFLNRFIYGNDYDLYAVNNREHEILILFGVAIVWRGRKAVSFLHYLSLIYFYSKIVNAIIFFFIGPLYGITYTFIAILIYIIFPEPVYNDPTDVVFFQGAALQRELERDKSITWIIEFFTTWSAECRYVAPTFAKLAKKYTLKNLRFGKLDVGRYQKEAEHFRINTNPLSKQLPSIAVFINGVQTNRRPNVGSNKRIIPFVFTENNCIVELELNNIYEDCKNKLKKREKFKND